MVEYVQLNSGIRYVAFRNQDLKEGTHENEGMNVSPHQDWIGVRAGS